MNATPIRACDLSAPPRLTLSPDVSALVALRTLLDAGASAAPVVDADGRLVGLLSELDGIRVCNRAWIEALPSPRVSEVMVQDVLVARPHTPALTVASWFEQHRFHQVPVVRGDGLLDGVVTRRAVLEAVLDQLEPVREHARGLYLSATDQEAPARVEAGRER